MSFNTMNTKVEIAKDVLSLIKSKFLNTKICGYTRFVVPYSSIKTKNVKDLILDKTIKKCDVCAKGALFISYIKLFNKVTLDEFKNNFDDEVHMKLMTGIYFIKPITPKIPTNTLNKTQIKTRL